jgi:hypothetical protein
VIGPVTGAPVSKASLAISKRSLRQAVRLLPQIDVPACLQARIQAKLDAARPSNVTVLRRRNWSFQPLEDGVVFDFLQ